MTPAALFRQCATALYGDEFVAPLARALGVEKSTVRRMAAGKSTIPPGVWGHIRTLVNERLKLMVNALDLLESLRPFAQP